jgi:hypothetical protein
MNRDLRFAPTMEKIKTQPKEICRTFEIAGHTVIIDDFIYRRLFKDPDILPRRKYTFIQGIQFSGGCPQIILKTDAKTIRLPRYIMHAGKDELVDHRDGNPLNNRRSNLRIATPRQNMLNRKLKNNTGLIGVSVSNIKGKFYLSARFKTKEGEKLNFYCQDTPFNRILAALARDKFVLQEGEEEFAPLNFPCWQYEPLRSILLAEDLKKFKEKSKRDEHGQTLTKTQTDTDKAVRKNSKP